MSYDIELNCPVTGQVIEFDFNHDIKGGTYAVGGTNLAQINITWNYSDILYRIFPEKGIRALYGMTGADSIPMLQLAADGLANDDSYDYWEATDGNVKRVLNQLLSFARLRPDGVWNGD
jgi:hypothetical protein